MPTTAEYVADGDYVHVCVRENIDVQSAVRQVQQWLTVASEHGCLRGLLDFGDSQVTASITGIYGFIGNMEQLGIPRGMKFASAAQKDLELQLFFETVARNQGWRYLHFSDLDAARDWLVTE